MTRKLIGAPIDRVDGRAKATGAALYPTDATFPNLAHAVLVPSSIAAGTIRDIDIADAKSMPGVLAVLTRANAPPLRDPPDLHLDPPLRYPFADDRILFRGQHIAIVVAETREEALDAARLVRAEYQEIAPTFGLRNPEAAIFADPYRTDATRGDVAAGLAVADVMLEETFTVPPLTNSPLGLFATVARWEEPDRLVVHDSTQWPLAVQRTLATMFGIAESDVRVLVPFLGGGFGAGLRVWPHAILTALAARVVGRPVKLVLTRPQMFTCIGHRPESFQRVRLGATRDGRLVALEHEGTSERGIADASFEVLTMCTSGAYACANVATHDRQIALNLPTPGAMRAPGAASGNFALETALDELSYRLGVDPIALRMRNYATVDPKSGLPWSSKAQRDCYRVGAERFGWAARNPRVRSMSEGQWLIGYGMAGANYEWYTQPCQAKITIARDGTARVRTAGTDIGTGTYTIASQLAAEMLGLEVGAVRVELGDSTLPPAPQSGGSGLAIAISGAIRDASLNLLRALLKLVADDRASPLRGKHLDEIAVTDGHIHLIDDPARRESYRDILARHKLDELTADGHVEPRSGNGEMAPSSAFAAYFAEVRVDRELGLVRVARVVSVVDAGRILNQKLARSQIIGGVVMGIGMTLLEETVFDPTGRVANATLGDYLIPVNADVPAIDVSFVGTPDRLNSNGIKGLGEIGIVGISAAIANAVHHATGIRVRDLPITIDKVLL
jgi:xanthine dehydrogenase YagR molybdenum-binding subunit